MSDQMKLWNAVYTTDPDHTKGFSKAGGFKGTAIKPYWLMKRATEMFGPCGIGWGWEEIENKMIAGVWCSKVTLWYETGGPFAGRGHIQQWGQTVMETTRTDKSTGEVKPYVDEEAPKKAVTDAVTKCLSYLGFGGDVHMGLFDDSKYVESIKKLTTAKAAKDRFSEIKAAICESDDPASTWHEYFATISEFKAQSSQLYDDLVAAAKQRKKELAEKDSESSGFGQDFANVK